MESDRSDRRVQYPDLEVRLAYEDGNAFAIVSRVSAAIRCHDRENGEAVARSFVDEAFDCPNYAALLNLCATYVELS